MHLTGKEYGILELFSLRKGTTLTKEMFLNHLYGGMDEPELKIIDVFICKLRKKLCLLAAAKTISRPSGAAAMCCARPRKTKGEPKPQVAVALNENAAMPGAWRVRVVYGGNGEEAERFESARPFRCYGPLAALQEQPERAGTAKQSLRMRRP